MLREKTVGITLALAIACSGLACNSTQKGAGIGAVGGAVIGGVIGHQTGHRTEGAVIGGVVGGVAGGAVGHHIEEGQSTNVRVSNANGSYTDVVIKKQDGVYVGPKGEKYEEMPTEEQLRQAGYGL